MQAASPLPIALALVLGVLNASPAPTGALPVAAEGGLPSPAPMPEKVLPGAVSIAVHGDIEGAVVLERKKDCRATGVGLRVGDVVVGVNQEPATSPEAMVKIANEVTGELQQQVMRAGDPFFVAIG